MAGSLWWRVSTLTMIATVIPPSNIHAQMTVVASAESRITVEIDNVPVPVALETIAHVAKLQLLYNSRTLPSATRVTLHLRDVPVSYAFATALVGTGFGVVISPSGQVILGHTEGTPRRVQGTIIGKVIDTKTGRPIANANVSLDGASRGVITSEDGTFRVGGVDAGTHTIGVKAIGYTRAARTVTIIDNTIVTATFALEPGASVLDQVVVTGTVIATERKVLPTPITVITAEDIQQKGITRIDQLFHGEVPGMWAQPQQTLDVINGAGLYVRGSANVDDKIAAGNAIKTYVDGIELSDPHFITQLDPSSIERIEIIRGPQASTIYGVNALYGVMQIFTKRGQFRQKPRLEAVLSAGTLKAPWAHVLSRPGAPEGTVAQMDHGVAFSGATASTSYRVNGHYHYDGPVQDGTWLHRWDANGGFRLTQKTTIADASLRVGRTSYRGETQLYAAQQALNGLWAFPFYSAFLPGRLGSRPIQTLGGTLTYQATPSWQHALTLGLDRNDYVDIFVPYATPIASGRPSDSLYLIQSQKQNRGSIAYNMTLRQVLGDRAAGLITVGWDHWDAASDAQLSRAPLTTGSLNALNLQRQTDHDTGYFTQLQVALADELFLTAGMRAEANPNFGGNHRIDYAPRGGVSYVQEVGSLTLKMRASYGRAITPPAIGAKVGGPQSATTLQLANPNLVPAVQLGGDAGVEMYYGRRTMFQATYYNQTTKDLTAVVSLPTFAPYVDGVLQYQNVGKVRSQGWELEGRLALPASLSLHGAYTVMSSHIVTLGPNYTPTGTWPYHASEQLRGVPHTTNATTLTYVHGRTTVETTAEHTGEALQVDYRPYSNGLYLRLNRPIPNTTVITALPAYTQVHFRMTQGITSHVSLFAQVSNLANEIAPAYYVYNTTVGRTMLAGVRLQ